MRLLAVDTAHRAHALLNTLTSPSDRAMDPGLKMPSDPKDDAARLLGVRGRLSAHGDQR
jgi:hypothetical protein